MAGLGRRSHYRKHLTDAVLHDFPEPSDKECIAKVVATRGSNQFDVLVSNESKPQLAILPSKFHKLIWVKRGDYCIVEMGEETNDTNSGVRFLITHILYKDQIKHLKDKKLWPKTKEFETNKDEAKSDEEENGDGIVFDAAVNDNEYFVNTNRINAMKIQDSSSESESSNGDIQQTETDDVIEFDTQDEELFANTNRVAALRIQESESDDSSIDKGEKLQRQEGSLQRGESIEFDTGNSRNTRRLTAMQMREEASVGRGESIEFDTGNNVRSMSDGLIYDTADAEEIEEPECESDDDDEDSIHQNETDDGLVYDTADAEEVDPDANEVSEDESDAEQLDITKTETDDGVEFDTANDTKQESHHHVV
jgi:probable RNA-binding protein EIF1AD